MSKDKKNILQMDVKDIFKFDKLSEEVTPKTVLMSAIILIVIGIYAFIAIRPKFVEYKSTKENLIKSEEELNKYKQKLDEIPLLEKKLDSLNKEADSKSSKLKHDMEDGLFLIGLDKVMKSLNVRLINYTIEDSIDYEKFYAIPMNLSVEGDYRKVREVITYLEEQKNITQVMDYNINVKMTEDKKETSKKVYWTRGDKNYHLDKSCKSMIEGEVLFGTPSQSGARNPDPDCVGDISNTIDVDVTSKATGDVSANIKFIVYSSDRDIIKLETDNPDKWKPGKYNPFKDTLN